MANDPVRSLLVKMAAPSIVAMLMQAMYNAVDGMFVARISDGSLAAVTLAFPIQMIMGALSTGIGVGINSCISRNLGARDYGAAAAAAVNGLALGVGTVAVMILFAIFGTNAFVDFYTDDPEVVEAAETYVRTICLLGCGSIFSQLTFSVLQGAGNTVLPMFSQMAGGLFVLILDPILIFGCGLGVHGAAIASSVSQMISAAIGMYGIFKVNRSNLKVTFKGFRPNRAIIGDILYVGIPSALTQATTSIVAGIVTKQVALYGTTAVALYGAFNRLNTFAYLPVFGVTRGMNPILGFCCGSHNRKRFLETRKLAVIIANTWTVAACMIFMLFPGPLLRLMSATPDMMELGIPTFRILAASLVIVGASIVMTQVFPPVKKSYVTMSSALLRQVVLMVPLCILLPRLIGVYGIWLSVCLADVLNFVYIIIMNIWLDRKVISKWGE